MCVCVVPTDLLLLLRGAYISACGLLRAERSAPHRFKFASIVLNYTKHGPSGWCGDPALFPISLGRLHTQYTHTQKKTQKKNKHGSPRETAIEASQRQHGVGGVCATRDVSVDATSGGETMLTPIAEARSRAVAPAPPAAALVEGSTSAVGTDSRDGGGRRVLGPPLPAVGGGDEEEAATTTTTTTDLLEEKTGCSEAWVGEREGTAARWAGDGERVAAANKEDGEGGEGVIVASTPRLILAEQRVESGFGGVYSYGEQSLGGEITSAAARAEAAAAARRLGGTDAVSINREDYNPDPSAEMDWNASSSLEEAAVAAAVAAVDRSLAAQRQLGVDADVEEGGGRDHHRRLSRREREGMRRRDMAKRVLSSSTSWVIHFGARRRQNTDHIDRAFVLPRVCFFVCLLFFVFFVPPNCFV